jgi:hypothetical protein
VEEITQTIAQHKKLVSVYFLKADYAINLQLDLLSNFNIAHNISSHSSIPTKGCSCGMKLEGVSMTTAHFSVVILTARFKSHEIKVLRPIPHL